MNWNSDLVDRTSASAAKVALFQSLFRGRDDVSPRRFESQKSGKSGYAPACANEWVRGVCEKPRIKCAESRVRCGLTRQRRLTRGRRSRHAGARIMNEQNVTLECHSG